MALEIKKQFVIKAAPAAVWDFLIDPRRVVRCLPGAAIGEQLDAKTYTGSMTVKVGPVSSSYKGKVIFERLDVATRTAEILANGQDVRGKGGADMRLTSSLKEISPGETEVTATSIVNVSGILAQMGRGMVQDVSDQMFQIFSQRMRAELESANAPAAAPPVGGPPETEVQTVQNVPAPVADVPAPAAAVPSAPAAPAAVMPETPVAAAAAAPASAPVPEVLDLGAIGGKAVARMFLRPTIWIALIAIGLVLYFLLRR